MLAFTCPGLHAALRFPAALTRIQGFISLTPRPYHWGQGGVQAGLRLAVVGVAVLVAAAVVDEADLEVHPALQPARKCRRHEDKSRVAIDSDCSQNRTPCRRRLGVFLTRILQKCGAEPL